VRGEEEFFEEKTGEAGGVVADDAVLLEQIAGDEANFPTEDFVAVEADRFGALGAVTADDFWGSSFVIGDDSIDEATADVVLDGAEVIAESVVGGFAGLGHEIGDVDAGSFGTGDSASNFRNEEIGDDAGVERAGPHEDEVGLLDGFDGLGKRTNAARGQLDFTNRNLAAGNACFPMDSLAVRKGSDEVDVGEGGRKDAATYGENFAGDAGGFGKITGNMSERRKKEIAEIVSAEAATGVEAILKETAEQGFILGERDHTVADIARRKHAIFPAETAGAATVIGDGNDGGKVGNRPLGSGMVIASTDNVFF